MGCALGALLASCTTSTDSDSQPMTMQSGGVGGLGGAGGVGGAGGLGGAGGASGTAGVSGSGGAGGVGGAGGLGGAGGQPTEIDAGDDDASMPDAGPPPVTHPRRFVLADEPLSKILLVDLDHPENDWDTDLPHSARDLQLIGDNRLLVGTIGGGGGYYEVDLTSGEIVDEELDHGDVRSVRRLASGNTLLAGMNLDGSNGTVVVELDAADNIVDKWVYPDYADLRLMRRTPAGNFLFGSTQAGNGGHDKMVEVTPEVDGDWDEVWSAQADNWPAYMGLRLANGDYAVANGHGASLLIFDDQGALQQTIGGMSQPDAELISPKHFSQFQVLPNDHFVVANWQDHADLGDQGRQLLEYDETGALVWWWEQDPERIGGVHGVLVLDGLDTMLLHDDTSGYVAPVP